MGGMVLWSPKSGSVVTPPNPNGPSIGATNNQGVNGTSMTFAVPSGVAAGEMMLLVIGCYGTCSTPSGWSPQVVPTDPTTRCVYVFSRVRASSDTSVTVTISATDSQTGTLIGIKSGSSVHTYAQAKGSVGVSPGTLMPSITTSVAPTLNLWIAYANSASAGSNTDFSWNPDKPRAAVVIGPISGTYYGSLSVIYATQTAAGASEAMRVIASGDRSLATFATLAIAQ